MFPTEIDCTHCGDTGITFIELHQAQVEMLMICNCPIGLEQPYRLPRWEMRVGGIASRKPFPTDWFKPKQPITNFFSNNLVDQWKAKIKVAEEFWDHQREAIT